MRGSWRRREDGDPFLSETNIHNIRTQLRNEAPFKRDVEEYARRVVMSNSSARTTRLSPAERILILNRLVLEHFQTTPPAHPPPPVATGKRFLSPPVAFERKDAVPIIQTTIVLNSDDRSHAQNSRGDELRFDVKFDSSTVGGDSLTIDSLLRKCVAIKPTYLLLPSTLQAEWIAAPFLALITDIDADGTVESTQPLLSGGTVLFIRDRLADDGHYRYKNVPTSELTMRSTNISKIKMNVVLPDGTTPPRTWSSGTLEYEFDMTRYGGARFESGRVIFDLGGIDGCAIATANIGDDCVLGGFILQSPFNVSTCDIASYAQLDGDNLYNATFRGLSEEQLPTMRLFQGCPATIQFDHTRLGNNQTDGGVLQETLQQQVDDATFNVALNWNGLNGSDASVLLSISDADRARFDLCLGFHDDVTCTVSMDASINPEITHRATVGNNGTTSGVLNGLRILDESSTAGIDDTYLFLTDARHLELHTSASLVDHQ